jgi:hypothetical protein
MQTQKGDQEKMSNGLAVRQPTEIQHAPRTFSFAEMQEMAEAVAKSGLFKMNGPQVLTLMLLSESLGLHPVQAVMRYHVYDGNFKFRPHVRAQQVANHIVNEWVEAGIVEKLAIETNGKRDNKKVAAVLQETWDSDPGDLMKSASDYLASKVIPAEAPEPGSDG